MEAAQAAFGERGRGRRWERERQDSAGLARARRVRRRPSRRSRRGLRVRPLDPGRRAAVRGRDLGRRPAVAPATRHPARLHAPPARRRPRLGRADRGALGLGGVDLRALRLRRRRTGHLAKSDPRRFALKRRPRVARDRQVDRRRRGVPALPGRLRPCPRRQGGDAVALRDVVEGVAARRPEGMATRSEPEVLCRRGGRGDRRGLRDLSRQGRVGGRLPQRRGARRRGDRRPLRPSSASSGASSTRST